MIDTVKFILIDDDSINNLVSSMMIRQVFPNAETIAHVNPNEGLECIMSELVVEVPKVCVVLLDINMPEMTGWEFLECLERNNVEIGANFHVYILSSSVNPYDINRASANPLIRGFVEKPLNIEFLTNLGRELGV